MAVVPSPSAVRTTIRARQTRFCGLLRLPMIASSRTRSSAVTVMEIPLRITEDRTKPNFQNPFSDSSVRCYPLTERDFRRHSPRSKAKAMDPEIARNQNYDDHYANDSEDVHSALLPFHDDSVRRARKPSVSAAIKLMASFPHRWLCSTEASKYK
jgi:hypothetical protein